MWNQLDTGAKESMSAETVDLKGFNGDPINAYYAHPTGSGTRPGIVLTHHMPGWDEFYRETARRFAQHGYNVICPNLYARAGHGTPDDIAAKVRADGGIGDDSVVGDLEAGLKFLKSQGTGKVGIIGTCSGGRHSYLAACKVQGFSAVADLWGGGVVMQPNPPKQPVAPVDFTKDLSIPLLGLFGNDDQRPSPADVDTHEAELKKHGKNYEFHRYDGAGHGFFYYDRPAYRQEQAMDGWNKVFTFFGKHLS